MARKNNEKNVAIESRIIYTGNWNRNDKDNPVWGKAICMVTIGEDDYVFQHDELGEMIQMHVKADEENIKMINNKNCDTGNITKPERTFKEKLMQYLQTGLDSWM
jgi:hypothetical protein